MCSCGKRIGWLNIAGHNVDNTVSTALEPFLVAFEYKSAHASSGCKISVKAWLSVVIALEGSKWPFDGGVPGIF